MNLEHLLPDMLLYRIGWWLMHFVWQGTIIAIITSGILMILKKADARARYIISCAALLLMILLPLGTVIFRNSVPSSIVSHVQIRKNESLNIQEFRTDNILTARQFRKEADQISFWKITIAVFEDHFPQISSMWIIGVILFSFYRFLVFFHLYRMIHTIKEPIDSIWQKRIQVWIKQLNIKQHIQILQSNKIDAPAVYGWIKPVLLVPVSFFAGIDSQCVESIIIHELAHISRYDYLVNMMQTIVEILGFFHPAVWWVSSRIRKEREDCCDDWAVRIIGDKLIYVKSLVQLEETRHCPHPLMAANGSELSRRVMRILNHQYSLQSSSVVYTFLFSLILVSLLLFSGFRFTGRSTLSQTNNVIEHLAAYYPFNGDARDMSGSEKHGNMKRVLLTEDRFEQENQAYLFNGKDAFIWAEGGGPFLFKGSITVSCWINPQKMIPYASWVSMSYLQRDRSQWRFGFGSNENSEWGFTETVEDEGNKVWTDYLITKSIIPLNEWTHVATVIDQEMNEIIIYKNGQRVGCFNQSKPYSQDKSFLIMGFQPDNKTYFPGSIDEVRIYNTTLSDNEVYKLYKMN